MARLQVDSGLRPVPLRPAATPVDTFVPSTEGRELAQLARGLQEFVPSLQRFANVLDEREAQAQLARGEQAAREIEEQRLSFKDAVKKGLINASENPWFVFGAKKQMGRASAGQYARALQAAIATSPEMQESENPEDFGEFEATFRKGWLEQNVGDNRDLHFEDGFKIVDGYVMDEGRRFIAAAGARMEKQAGERLGIIIGQVLDQHYTEGAPMAAALIDMEMRSYLFDNPKAGRIANKQAITAIADWARVNYKTVGREDIEALLKAISAGPGSNLFGLKEGKQMLVQVEREIISMRGAADNLEAQQERRAFEKKEQAFWSDVSTSMVESMKAGSLASTDLTPLIARLTEIDPSPDAPAKLFRLRQSLLAARGNPDSVREALMWVHGVSEDRPGQFLSMKQLASFATAEGFTAQEYASVMNEIQQRDQSAAEGAANGGSKLLNNNFYQEGKQYILGKMQDPFGVSSERERAAAREAIRDFTASFLQQQQKITTLPSPQAQNEYIQQLAEQSFRVHASPRMLQEHNKEMEGAGVNRQAQSVFQQAMQDITDADFNALPTALADYNAWRTDRQNHPQLSNETRDLLRRLKVPFDEKTLRLFFLEWERNF